MLPYKKVGSVNDKTGQNQPLISQNNQGTHTEQAVYFSGYNGTTMPGLDHGLNKLFLNTLQFSFLYSQRDIIITSSL